MKQYVIIGTGVSGVSAAQAIKENDPEGRIILIGDDQAGYYSRPGLAYYLTGEIPEDMLFPFSQDEFRSLGAAIMNDHVEAILPESQKIKLAETGMVSYDRLLLAVGSSARKSPLPGADLEGVVTLDDLSDARNILRLTKKARSAVIVGGGITALEIVEGLRARGLQVHYLLRGDRYWTNVLDEVESRIVEHRLIEEGVKIHYFTEIEALREKKGRISGVLTKSGESLRCELLAVAIGIQPRIGLAKSANIDVDRGILVNEFLETSAPNIFAAGDVAQVYDPWSGNNVLDSLWGPARKQGQTAGMNMAGARQAYFKGVPFNVTRLAGLTTTIIGTVGSGKDQDLVGIARGDSETWRRLPYAISAQNNFDVNRLRILLGHQSILGAIVMGDQTLSQPIYELVVEKADIRPIREELTQADAPIGDVLSDFYSSWTGRNQ